MPTSSKSGSWYRIGTFVLQGRHKWVTFAVVLLATVAGIAFVWPEDEAPGDFCAHIGTKAIERYAPGAKLEGNADGWSYLSCTADSDTKGVFLNMSFSRSDESANNFADMCKRAKWSVKKHDVTIGNDSGQTLTLIKPADTAEFGDRMCGTVYISQILADEVRIETDIHVVRGRDVVGVSHNARNESRGEVLRRTVDLARLILEKTKE